MKKYTRKSLAGLSKDSLAVLYALNLAYPKPVGEEEIIKIVNDQKLTDKTSDELIGLLMEN